MMKKIMVFLITFLLTATMIACEGFGIPPVTDINDSDNGSDIVDDDTVDDPSDDDPADDPSDDDNLSVTQALTVENDTLITVQGVVTSYPHYDLNPGFFIQDTDGTAMFIRKDFGDGHPGVAIGNKVTVQGTKELYTEFDNAIFQIGEDAVLIHNDEGNHAITVIDTLSLNEIADNFYDYVSMRFKVYDVPIDHIDGSWIVLDTGVFGRDIRFHTGSYSIGSGGTGDTFEWIEFTVKDLFYGNIRVETVIYSYAIDDDPVEATLETFLDIYYLNDLHGAIVGGGTHMGLAYIGNFLIENKDAYPDNTIILAGGDMLQGDFLSNYFYGASVIELFSAMYFDAFVIGNHEFDWGLETITPYFIPDSEYYIANYPALGANIHYRGTSDLPEGIDPYVILERDGLRIGIIGTIGEGLDSSISPQLVEDYEFKSPLPIISEYAYYLRVEEDCDLVLLLTHDVGAVNLGAASLTGDYRIDAIFNAHNHNLYAHFEQGIPVIQSGSSGSHVGHIRFEFYDDGTTTIEIHNYTKADMPLLNTPHPDIQAMIDGYLLETEAYYTTIITAGEYMSREDLGEFLAQLMKQSTNADISIVNRFGARSPLYNNQPISEALLHTIYPFDNEIKTVSLKGSDINAYIAAWNNIVVTSLEEIHDDQWYKVVTVDFLFDREDNPFLYGNDITFTSLYCRDLFLEELIAQSAVYTTFKRSNIILMDDKSSEYQQDSP